MHMPSVWVWIMIFFVEEINIGSRSITLRWYLKSVERRQIVFGWLTLKSVVIQDFCRLGPIKVNCTHKLLIEVGENLR